MHLHSYLRSAAEIISVYDGTIPFAAWLKGFFKQHKKFGSKDRKMIADLCFCFFRLGQAFAQQSIEEQLLFGQLLCRNESVFIAELKPEWKEVAALSLEKKLAFLQADKAVSFFPFLDEVSAEIDEVFFALSHLTQPDLFLRIRPRRREATIKKLEAASIVFSIEGDCVRLSNATKIEDVIELDKDAVVQDKSSQQVLLPLQSEIRSAWDCCAASGGKSILLHDYFPQAQLTVSDVRESILHNLRNRFRRAGIFSYQSFVADVSSPQFSLDQKFDVVICDAPCSGSGTWGRTPEQLRFFQKEKISHYASLQKAIAVNASRCLKGGGAFLYITCSVFKKENEEVVAHLLQQTELKLVVQRYFKGYTEKADTLFAALFAY